MKKINDSAVQSYVDKLTAQKNELEDKLNALPKYTTNMKMGRESLRAVSNIADVEKYYKIIYDEEMKHDSFLSFLCEHGLAADKDIADLYPKEPYTYEGYTLAEWKTDLGILTKAVLYKQKISRIEYALSKLQTFYSEEHNRSVEFDTLVSYINLL